MISAEDILASPRAVGLPASPPQRAAVRIMAGEPLGELAEHPDVLAMVGGPEAVSALALMVGQPPAVVCYVAAARTGKTLTAVARAIHISQTVNLEGVRGNEGEIPRIVVVSLSLDHARVFFGNLVGTVRARPALRQLLVGEPTADSIALRHPSGRLIEIRVVAQSAAGAAVVARWAAALIIDEGTRMGFDGVVRLQDLLSAVRVRLLPGGQILIIGSPWAPAGPVYDAWCTSFGKPTPDMVVLHGTGPMLNPSWFTPERCERLRKQDPIAYESDVLGRFVEGELTLFDHLQLRKSQRATLERRPPEESRWVPYSPRAAAIDLGISRNPSTLAVSWLERDELHAVSGRERLVVGLTKEWQGTAESPMDISRFFFEVGKAISFYGIREVWSDQFSFGAAREIAKQQGITLRLREAADLSDMWMNLVRFVSEDAIELPSDPQVVADLAGVRSKPTAEGGMRIYLPTVGNRHSDYAPAIALSAMHCTRHQPGRVIIGQRQVLPF